MSSPATTRSRSRLEWAVLILIPIMGNLLLAIVLFAGLPRALGTDGASPAPIPSPPAADPLPQSQLTSIIAAVEGSTGHHYSCDGPWRTPDGWSNWACRTNETLVVFQGANARHITRLDATSFGFDVAMTDLPAWAAAVQMAPESGQLSESWVADELGGVASMEISSVQLTVGGARGALNLRIQSEGARP